MKQTPRKKIEKYLYFYVVQELTKLIVAVEVGEWLLYGECGLGRGRGARIVCSGSWSGGYKHLCIYTTQANEALRSNLSKITQLTNDRTGI